MNGDSAELWREYVKMELGFMESVRRRWDVLGIETGEEQEKVMNGGIVETVISNAGRVDIFEDLIAEYPMDGGVREKLLNYLHRCKIT